VEKKYGKEFNELRERLCFLDGPHVFRRGSAIEPLEYAMRSRVLDALGVTGKPSSW
jgi:hypothetical protein